MTGDDLLPRAAELGYGEPVAANAYLGGWGIAECVRAGADVVVTGRVTDASLAVGPAAARFGWALDDFDALAGAMAAGHVIECGAQATGGNYSFFTEIADLRHPGLPIAEIYAGRLQRDHQASRHRRRRHRRDRDRAAAVRGGRAAVRRA